MRDWVRGEKKEKIMLKHVLVPLDGSHLAAMALKVAIHTISPECQITLLTSVLPPEIPIYGDIAPMSVNVDDYSLLETLRYNAQSYLEGVAESLRQQGVRAHIAVEVGEAADTIIRVADELDVDQIIMSTHGRTGIGRWVFGSVTHRVLSAATRPVLVVPNRKIEAHLDRQPLEVNDG